MIYDECNQIINDSLVDGHVSFLLFELFCQVEETTVHDFAIALRSFL